MALLVGPIWCKMIPCLEKFVFFLSVLRPSELIRIEPFEKLKLTSNVLDKMISMESNEGFSVVQCAALCREQGCNLWRQIPPSVCQVGFQSFLAPPAAQPGSFSAGNGEKFFSSVEPDLGKLRQRERDLSYPWSTNWVRCGWRLESSVNFERSTKSN